MSYNVWIVKQTEKHPYHGLELSNKKEGTIEPYNN